MCSICKQSEMGKVRQAELDAAQRQLALLTKEQQGRRYAGDLSAVEMRVKRAQQSMARLHEDYVFIEAYN